MPSRNPAQHVNDPGVAHIARKPIGNDFEQKMGGRVFEVIDIRLRIYAIDSVGRLSVFS